MTFEPRFRVRVEKCSTCVYSLHYPKETRDRLMADVEAADGFVACHKHEGVCCRGYWNAVGDSGGTPAQLAVRFLALGLDAVGWVEPGQYPAREDDDAAGGDLPAE